MPTTASFPNSGAFDDVNTNILPGIWNPGEAMDIVTKDQQYLWIARNALMREQQLGRNTQINVMKNQALGGGSFDGYQVLDSTTWDGAEAALFGRGHHYVPIQISLTEELDLEGPSKIKDRILEMRDQASRNLANKLYEAMIVGNASDSSSIIGLEQAVPDTTHIDFNDTGTGTTATSANDLAFANQWMTRQTVSAFGGITRVAWDAESEDFAGDGDFWTPISVNFFGAETTANTNRRFEFDTNGIPHEGLQLLYQIVGFLNVGSDSPDLIMSSRRPAFDYVRGMMGKVSIRRGPTEYGGVDFPFDHFQFENLTWLQDPNLVTQSANDGTAGDHNVYILNTDYIKWLVDPRISFGLVQPRGPHDQLASVQYMLVRHQQIFSKPGMNARIFAYPA